MTDLDTQDGQFVLDSAGMRLRRARERADLSLTDISDRTKIAERHLQAIEEDRFTDLAGKTYAVGFSRNYAKAVGLDDAEIAEAVRVQLDAEQDNWPKPQPDTFEPGDPARVPPSRIAWIAGLGAIVVIGLLYVFGRSFLSPAAELPDILAKRSEAASPAVAARPTSTPARLGGEVVFTAMEPGIWVKFYDANGTQLFQKQMEQGERYTVPANAEGPQIWTARPDALRITVGGQPVPRLADKPITIKDRPVTAAALVANDNTSAAAAISEAARDPVPAATRPGSERTVALPKAFAPVSESSPAPSTVAQ